MRGKVDRFKYLGLTIQRNGQGARRECRQGGVVGDECQRVICERGLEDHNETCCDNKQEAAVQMLSLSLGVSRITNEYIRWTAQLEWVWTWFRCRGGIVF